MQEILYLEIPTPDIAKVKTWLQQEWIPPTGEKIISPDGIRLLFTNTTNTPSTISESNTSLPEEIWAVVWSLQRTTYLKVFRVGDRSIPSEKQILQELTAKLRSQFPHQYPAPPAIDLSTQSIFQALAPYYPLTVKYFQRIPNGEYDLKRVYWWEQRWREGVRNPQTPKNVIFTHKESSPKNSYPIQHQSNTISSPEKDYDLIYVGGALGIVHAAVMARLGYKVLLLERLPFGKMNREWNISRSEFQSLINLGLFTSDEFESIIAREYKDGFNKFFDANNPSQCKAAVLHTPTVLNIAIDSEKLLRLCGEKFQAAGGEIWDETEFIQADIYSDRVILKSKHLPSQAEKIAKGRLLVDAMGTASPIAWQLNGKRAFDSVCPTVGGIITSGFEPGVWDSEYGDVLNSHGDISRGRQLIWELFPGENNDLTIYLFHYHQVNPENPGSLLEMYEDFFTILPEYRRCDMDKLTWKKATFGYIPGHFSVNSRDRQVALDRLIAIGDAASLQSPLVFTGFGSLVRNLFRLTDLLNTALKHDLLTAKQLNQIRSYQSNVAVTWLFSKGMMVPTGKFIAPQKINAMLNTFFGILANETPIVAETFIKDRIDWLTFNRLALQAASNNPSMLLWIWELAGVKDMLRWLGSYLEFTLFTLLSWLFAWLPSFARQIQPIIENRYPAVWLWLLATTYALTDGMGRPQLSRVSNYNNQKNINTAKIPV